MPVAATAARAVLAAGPPEQPAARALAGAAEAERHRGDRQHQRDDLEPAQRHLVRAGRGAHAVELQPERVVRGGQHARRAHHEEHDQEREGRHQRDQVAVTTSRTHGLSSITARLGLAGADDRAEDRLDAREDVRHAGEVAEHVVAVEAQQRQELLEEDHVLEERHQQRHLRARGEVDAPGEQREDRVEVDAAEVRPQPARAVEPVGVGHVAVEGGPHEVDADAHDTGPRAAVPARAGVAELVERGRDDDRREHAEEQRRGVEGAPQAAGEAVDPEQPDVEGRDAEQQRDLHVRPVQDVSAPATR